MVPHPGDSGNSRSARRLNEPRPALVVCEDGVPAAVNRVRRGPRCGRNGACADRWWTEEPVERRYFEAMLETGRNVVVFRDESSGRWFRQSAWSSRGTTTS